MHAKVVDGQHVGPAQAEDQKHLNRPRADAANRSESFDELVVGEFVRVFKRGNDAGDGFCGKVFDRKDFRSREPGFTQSGLANFEHLLGSGRPAI